MNAKYHIRHGCILKILFNQGQICLDFLLPYNTSLILIPNWKKFVQDSAVNKHISIWIFSTFTFTGYIAFERLREKKQSVKKKLIIEVSSSLIELSYDAKYKEICAGFSCHQLYECWCILFIYSERFLFAAWAAPPARRSPPVLVAGPQGRKNWL